MRVITLPIGWTVLLDCVVWAVVGTLTGYLTHRVGPDGFTHDGPITRLRAFEADGRWYERRLRIKAWKARLPEAGALFRDGFSKRDLRSAEVEHLRRFVVETRRAEITHWIVLACGPFFFLWNPWGLAVVMLVYAVVANVPCLLIQRYNRARLLRVIATASRSRGRVGDPPA